MKNSTIVLGAVVVGILWWKKNNGHGFSPVLKSFGMEGEPTSDTVSTINMRNWFAQWNNATPPSTY